MYLLASNHQISETERYSVYHVFRNIKLEMYMKKFGIWAVAALVQCRFAGDYEDKVAVSPGNRSNLSDCKVCNG